MLLKIKDLIGFTVKAPDEDLGKVKEFYIDDRNWSIRYILVDTSEWLTERRVLLSPFAFGKPNTKLKVIEQELTREQIKSSPGIAEYGRITQNEEIRLCDYFGWPVFCEDTAADLHEQITDIEREGPSADEHDVGTHMISSSHLKGFSVEGIDGEVGYVEDMILDDDTWTIRYLAADTHKWLPGRKVLIATEWIERINEPDETMHVDMSKKLFKDSPEYDPSQPITRNYEDKYYDYFNRPKYWMEIPGLPQ
jgi:hypothetical protein